MNSFLLALSKRFFLFFFAMMSFAVGDEGANCFSFLQWRQNTLFQLDEWLEQITPSNARMFSICPSLPIYTCHHCLAELTAFATTHGFFSCKSPLIGMVTEEVMDIEPIQKALVSLMQIPSSFFVELATAEILSKALAYRNLQKGMKILIPSFLQGNLNLVEYELEEVLNLWQEMPAFGFVAKKEEANPILLFRGTDLSLTSKKSWASLLSDMDIAGTGFSTFHFARSDIHNWLVKAFSLSKRKTKTMGFSLGGVLAMYTALFEKEWVDLEESIAFNPPGVSTSIAKRWKENHIPFKVYITQGDLIPKLGIQPSPAYILFGETTLSPIKAHTALMTAETFFVGELLR